MGPFGCCYNGRIMNLDLLRDNAIATTNEETVYFKNWHLATGSHGGMPEPDADSVVHNVLLRAQW